MQDQNIEKFTLTAQKMYELFSVKSVKTGFLNDPTTAQCSVYYKGKIIASFYDPGCGGGVAEVNFKTDKAELEFNNFCNEYDAQSFFNSEDMNNHDVFIYIIYDLINKAKEQKNLAKIERRCKKSIVYGTHFHFHEVGFTGIKDLAEMLEYEDGLKSLQEIYDHAKAKLGEGDKIYNPIEQLTKLGIKP
ncbi:TPA: hypothetical protein RI785_002280 [Vibrio cholerae]|uniref:Uncharacterized protein n=1 Tax=Vibrio cholerae TaxID=666 RepID=A0A5Q6PDZ0_VIBCL|nr:hypothetical protein [Vibrio cholerae]KAA1253088.1 hypothetical protein F0M16_19290 [Vibrio cholerae]HDV5593562.1 hypothetical protein [Vibrio cholerae]